jgi:hypothetical protein
VEEKQRLHLVELLSHPFEQPSPEAPTLRRVAVQGDGVKTQGDFHQPHTSRASQLGEATPTQPRQPRPQNAPRGRQVLQPQLLVAAPEALHLLLARGAEVVRPVKVFGQPGPARLEPSAVVGAGLPGALGPGRRDGPEAHRTRPIARTGHERRAVFEIGQRHPAPLRRIHRREAPPDGVGGIPGPAKGSLPPDGHLHEGRRRRHGTVAIKVSIAKDGQVAGHRSHPKACKQAAGRLAARGPGVPREVTLGAGLEHGKVAVKAQRLVGVVVPMNRPGDERLLGSDGTDAVVHEVEGALEKHHQRPFRGPHLPVQKTKFEGCVFVDAQGLVWLRGGLQPTMMTVVWLGAIWAPAGALALMPFCPVGLSTVMASAP